MALFEYGGSGTITRMLTKLHTLLGDYLKTDQLDSAVDDALAQAKESGEFDGVDGVSVVSVEQTTTSTADGGENIITVTLSNGNKATFKVKNGSKGPAGANGSSYVLTDEDKQAIADLAAALVDVSGKLDKSGGTMTGALVAQNNANYTTKQVRNIITINKGDAFPSGANGDICFVRKV